MASLLPRDWQGVVPASCRSGEDVVVLVHGLFATAGVMRPLRRGIEGIAGTHTAAFTYVPGTGVEDIARALDRVLGTLPSDARIHLFGHSMGGLVVRWFVQELRRDPRVVQTVTVATPFQGARGAVFMPGRAGRDIRAGSAVLERLQASAASVDLPHLSILGGLDTAVPLATAFPVGERLVIPQCGHNGLLFHPVVRQAVVERVLGSRCGSAEATASFSPSGAEGSVVPLRA
jgi:triacylglycerol lipase